MGFFNDFKFFFMPDTKATELNAIQKKEWKQTLKMFETEPYKQIHLWASDDFGWAFLSGNGKRYKISHTDSVDKIQNICSIILK